MSICASSPASQPSRSLSAGVLVSGQSTPVARLFKDGIRVAAAEVSAEEIENRALCFLLKNVGDAVGIGPLRRTATGLWLAPVLEAATGHPIGQLCYTAAGELVARQSTPLEELLGVGDGA